MTSTPQSPPSYGRSKKWLFNLLFMGIFICFLVVIELILRFVDYGIDTRMFIRPRYMPEVYISNPLFIDKYFSKASDQNEFYIKNIFSAEKPRGLLRGIIIGGSTAEGYPFHSNQAAAAIAEAALNSISTDNTFEILNIGYSAMTSYYVRDVALKALDYEPDFLIIYAGHNEYYGTLSYSSGGNYAIKHLYLSLKELKLFQLLLNILNRQSAAYDDNITLMAEQFNNTRFPRDSRIDQQVADDFIRNIAAVVNACKKRNIPVIIFEPVSNLYDMPPFSGVADSSFSDFIDNYNNSIVNNDLSAINNYYNRAVSDSSYLTNANIVYLNARANEIINNLVDPETYIQAKDLDSTPFRARSELIESLREYCNSDTINNNIIYIPTFEMLERKYGTDIFSNRLFIDHLHFNLSGQSVIAGLLAEIIAEHYNYSIDQKDMLQSFFQDIKNVSNAVHLSPLDELMPYMKVDALQAQPPFSIMRLPYEMPDYSDILQKNEVLSTKEYLEYIESVESFTEDELYNYVLEYYKSQNNAGKIHEYLLSTYTIVPGSYLAIYELAEFYGMLGNPPEDPLALFLRAYLLSNGSNAIYNDMLTYLYRENRLNEMNQINTMYRNLRE